MTEIKLPSMMETVSQMKRLLIENGSKGPFECHMTEHQYDQLLHEIAPLLESGPPKRIGISNISYDEVKIIVCPPREYNLK